MFINHSSKDVTAKIVFYGPGLSGKTTCLQYIFSVTNPSTRGELISIETEIERTLFFDLLPVNVGLLKGYKTKFQLYTVPGQVFYDSTRKLVLKGADGIIFVADSQKMMERPNQESMENLKTNLASHKLDINEIPMVFQYNKRDLNNIFSIEELNKLLNPRDLPSFGSIATEGKGVLEALRAISSLILGKIKYLLDQTKEDLAAEPPVDFAFNTKHKIIDRENLPLKKIQTDSFEAINQKLNIKDSEIKPIDQIKAAYSEDELKVETIEEIDDLNDIIFNQEPVESEPALDMEAFKIDAQAKKDREIKETNTQKKEAENINVPNIPEIDELNNEEKDLVGKTIFEIDGDTSDFTDIEEIVGKEPEKEKEIEIEVDQEPFKGMQDIPIGMDEEPGPTKSELGEPLEEDIVELEQIGELVAEGDVQKITQTPGDENSTDDIRDAEPFKLEEEENLDFNETPFQDLEDVQEIENEVPFIDLENAKEVEKINEENKVKKPGTVKPLEEISTFEELKRTFKKEDKRIPVTPRSMDLLEQLRDKTRLTLIRDVEVKGPYVRLHIDVKDQDSNLLESVKVKITPEIKKVTLILDVKK